MKRLAGFRLPFVVVALALLFQATTAKADVDLGRLVTLFSESGTSSATGRATSSIPRSTRDMNVMLSALAHQPSGKMRVLVRGEPLPDAKALGLTRLGSGLYALTADAAQVKNFLAAHPSHRVTWSPPRKPLLDLAVTQVHADVAHRDYGLSGRGVVVGIVDTGVDVRHPDLRRADGTSRISWLLDLSKSKAERQPDLESEFGCDSVDAPCAIFSGADLDELVGNDISGDEPRDNYGHGTHVASLAAGNGLSNSPPKYIGMAPEASLIVVRATRDGEGGILDPDIILATNFIFSMAEKMGMPAVVNLSLGGDYGAHDGTSELERELSALVGPSQPGRSIVVAGGNSGLLFSQPGSPYPEPFGIHSTVQVPPYGSARVPLLIGKNAYTDADSAVYLWIAARPGDNLSVGLDGQGSQIIAPLAVGDAAVVEKDGIKAIIENGVTESDDLNSVDHSGTFVAIEGAFENDTVLALTFEGYGTASIWLQPAGGLDPAVNGTGVLMPASQREGTITVPASAPELIAVGATLDRTSWVDVDGEAQSVVKGIAPRQFAGEVVPFSAAGPNALDDIKPDIVAPGAYIVGAMSKVTDPRTLGAKYGMFAGGPMCSTNTQSCLVVDDYHAISLGTSMASPVVAGAIALLLERDPKLTQPRILRALQSGARSVFNLFSTYTQAGAGALDVEGALLALENRAVGTKVSPSRSYLSLSAAYIRPDPKWPVSAMLHLRDDRDKAVDVASDRVKIRTGHGAVVRSLKRQGPGFFTFGIAGQAESGGERMTIEAFVDGGVVCRTERPIAVDAPNVRSFAVADSGCATSPASRIGKSGSWLLAAALGLLIRACRRSQRRRAPAAQMSL